MLCDRSAWRSLQKKTAILAPATEKRCLATLRQGVRGFRWMLKLLGRWLFFLENPGSVFWTYGCPPVNSGKCHVVLPTTFACRCDLIKVPPTMQWDVHMWTRASGMLHFDNFCMQMWPHRYCRPCLRKQHRHTLPVGLAGLCLPEAYSHQGRCRPTLTSLWTSSAAHCNTRATRRATRALLL